MLESGLIFLSFIFFLICIFFLIKYLFVYFGVLVVSDTDIWQFQRTRLIIISVQDI